MIRDAQTTMWEAAALTVTTVSTKVLDNGPAGGIGNDIPTGEPLCAVITIGVAAAFTTDETYLFQVVTATANDLTTGQKVIAQSKPYAIAQAAELATGKRVFVPIPPGSVDQRFLGLKYIGGGTAPTITVTAWITAMSMLASDERKFASQLITIQ